MEKLSKRCSTGTCCTGEQSGVEEVHDRCVADAAWVSSTGEAFQEIVGARTRPEEVDLMLEIVKEGVFLKPFWYWDTCRKLTMVQVCLWKIFQPRFLCRGVFCIASHRREIAEIRKESHERNHGAPPQLFWKNMLKVPCFASEGKGETTTVEYKLKWTKKRWQLGFPRLHGLWMQQWCLSWYSRIVLRLLQQLILSFKFFDFFNTWGESHTQVWLCFAWTREYGSSDAHSVLFFESLAQTHTEQGTDFNVDGQYHLKWLSTWKEVRARFARVAFRLCLWIQRNWMPSCWFGKITSMKSFYDVKYTGTWQWTEHDFWTHTRYPPYPEREKNQSLDVDV